MVARLGDKKTFPFKALTGGSFLKYLKVEQGQFAIRELKILSCRESGRFENKW
jgi:hypothetical protein